MCKTIFFLFLYVHVVGCYWFWIVKKKQKWYPPLDAIWGDMDHLDLYTKPVSYQYILCVYTSLLFVGTNDILPRSDLGVASGGMGNFFGAVLMNILFGQLVILFN